jgi:hypothetical protein
MTQKPVLRAEEEVGMLSKCGMIQKGEGNRPSFLEKFAKSEIFMGIAHSAGQ